MQLRLAVHAHLFHVSPQVKLRRDLLDSIEVFLDWIDELTVVRGRRYFTEGKVTEVTCIQQDHLYSAILQDGNEYHVGLEFNEDGWAGECSCPVAVDCKHIVAAILALQQSAGPGGELELSVLQSPPKPPSERKAPEARLEVMLAEKLGRRLRADELEYLSQVQSLYTSAKTRGLTEYGFMHFARSRSAFETYTGWQPLELWPEFPENAYTFWLYLAWEFRRREIEAPAFMNAITDLNLIAPRMEEWERQKEILHWKAWLHAYAGETSEPPLLELRLIILPKEARLQWRTHSEAAFAELKQNQARKIADQQNQGALIIAPDSLPLWSVAYKPWSNENWWSFKYDDVRGSTPLSRLLRTPLSPELVVCADGQPLARAAEPLRLKLQPPETADGDYALEITTADGCAPPPVLCTMSGHPTLYLTERCLYHGPSAEALGAKRRATIPARALESSDGLRFLHSNRLPFPQHLQERVTTVPISVQISCQVKPSYPGAQSENIVIQVTAQGAGSLKEEFTRDGWQHSSGAGPKKVPKEDTGNFVIYDRTAQKHFPRLLNSLDAKWDGYPGAWRFKVNRKTPELLAQWLRSVPPEIELVLDKELATLLDEPVSGTISLDLTESGIDWFDLKVVLNVGDTTLTQEELKLLLNARGGYVRLAKKGWRRLQFKLTEDEDEQLARLGLNATDFTAEPQRLHAFQLADEAARKFLPPDRVEKIQRRASELKTRVTPPLPEAIRAEMRPYQTEGFHFLAYLTTNRFGGVLADDMGLGKTIQTLAWLAWLRERSASSQPGDCASLVICPKSVMDNWQTESERFYPGLRVRLWQGESADQLTISRESFDLIVINYAQLRSLWPAIGELQWFAVILDEAQCIKNPDSQTAQAARSLKAENRLALTGTPIENRLLDLWSILAFAMPGVLGNRNNFLRRFDAKDDALARRRLAARVRPFLLRRTKGQVAKDLPDRIEEDLLSEMEGKQKTLYRAELKRAQQLLLGLKSTQQLNKERFNILTSLLRLRQICCHPALVDSKLENTESAKLAALEDLLEPLMEEGHKVLVFSQFVTMLDLLRKKMKERQWPFFFLAGETENRGDLVRDFQSAEGGAVFLISLKAGGFGLNLTAASYVVLFDPWWNPAVENQAIDRTHRIGQTSKVIAYRLLIRDSIEQKIRALQKEKAALADDVLGEERFGQSLTLADLNFLFAD